VLAFSPLGNGMAQLRAADPERALASVAAVTGKTEAQVALNWAISHEGVIALTRASSAERVEENCAASGWRLTPEQMRMLEMNVKFRSRGAVESGLRRLALRATQMMGRV
jgi:diketogulonate reductase-like aldo/keto reductase